jgi:hypothetical protein
VFATASGIEDVQQLCYVFQPAGAARAPAGARAAPAGPARSRRSLVPVASTPGTGAGAARSNATTAGGRRRWRLAAALAGVSVAVATGAYLAVDRANSAGPVGFDYRGEVALALQGRKPGVPYTYGFIVMNSGDRDAVLKSVELVGDARDVTVGPASTAGGARTFNVASATGYPPELDVPVVPLAGSVVPAHSDTRPDGSPGMGVNVLVRVVVNRPGVYRFTGAKVRYAVGDHEYTYVDPADLMLCTSECPTS